MRTQDVRVGVEYLYRGNVVTVIQRIRGGETSQREMQSGQLFTGYKHKQKRFLLSNGKEVYANSLSTLNTNNNGL